MNIVDISKDLNMEKTFLMDCLLKYTDFERFDFIPDNTAAWKKICKALASAMTLDMEVKPSKVDTFDEKYLTRSEVEYYRTKLSDPMYMKKATESVADEFLLGRSE